MEIACSEKSAKSETSNYGLRFLTFFNAASKNVKSRVFWIFKKRKKRILELWRRLAEILGNDPFFDRRSSGNRGDGCLRREVAPSRAYIGVWGEL